MVYPFVYLSTSMFFFCLFISFDPSKNCNIYISFVTAIKTHTNKKKINSLFLNLNFQLILLFQLRMNLMYYTMPMFKEEDNPASFSPHLQTRVLTFFYLLVFNLKLLLSPMVLSYDWQIGSIPLVESVTDPRNMETLLMMFTFGSLFMVTLKKWFSERYNVEVGYVVYFCFI